VSHGRSLVLVETDRKGGRKGREEEPEGLRWRSASPSKKKRGGKGGRRGELTEGRNRLTIALHSNRRDRKGEGKEKREKKKGMRTEDRSPWRSNSLCSSAIEFSAMVREGKKGKKKGGRIVSQKRADSVLSLHLRHSERRRRGKKEGRKGGNRAGRSRQRLYSFPFGKKEGERKETSFPLDMKVF